MDPPPPSPDSRRPTASAPPPAPLDELLTEHASELHAFVRLRSGAMLRSLESTNDLVQSVYREVLEHKERFRHAGDDGFRRWLFTTAARKIANRVEYWRAQKRDPAQATPLVDASGSSDLLATYATFCTPTQAMRSEEELRRIEAAFDQLPEHYREVIALSRVARLAPEAVAQQMGRSEGSTRMLLFRALTRLAELLDER